MPLMVLQRTLNRYFCSNRKPLIKHVSNTFLTCYNRGKQYSSSNAKLANVLNEWTEKFAEKSIPESSISAEYIIAHVIGEKTLYNISDETFLTEAQIKKVNVLCKKRLQRMPVQYVIEEWDFHDLTLKMKPPVLIPRPETEELAVLCSNNLTETLTTSNFNSSPRLLEIGSGSGALTIYLLKRFENLTATAVDISGTACELTQQNAEAHHVEDRLTMVQGDFNDEQIQSRLQSMGPYTMVVSNPPYISTDEMEELAPEISRFEDHGALHGGPDGLDLIKDILIKSQHLLLDNGHLLLEVGTLHPEMVESFVSTEKSMEVLEYQSTKKDFYGKNRFCHMLKSGHKKREQVSKE